MAGLGTEVRGAKDYCSTAAETHCLDAHGKLNCTSKCDLRRGEDAKVARVRRKMHSVPWLKHWPALAPAVSHQGDAPNVSACVSPCY